MTPARNVPTVALVAASIALVACRPPHANTPIESEGRRYGDVMTEVGRRFEQAGRAVSANRWELADYDVGEIREIFEGDLQTARTPADVHADLRALARSVGALPDDLQRAVASRDLHVFQSAFARAATACNACHVAAGKGYIEVPTVIGTPVPLLSLLGPAVTP